MADISEAMRGLGDAARALHVPFISGNVSMYNEGSTAPIPVTPTLLGAGLVEDVRKCVTTDLKREGSRLYLVGASTRDEMGGSEYYALLGGTSSAVPRVDWPFTKKAAEAVVTAIERGLVWACHDVSAGGLAVALAEMAIGGGIGATVHLDALGGLPADVKLFSESNTRWVIEAKNASALEDHFRAAGVPCWAFGQCGGDELRFMERRADVGRAPLTACDDAWRNGLTNLVVGR
jgi:phosphoribosylformylglycinamidine synthase